MSDVKDKHDLAWLHAALIELSEKFWYCTFLSDIGPYYITTKRSYYEYVYKNMEWNEELLHLSRLKAAANQFIDVTEIHIVHI